MKNLRTLTVVLLLVCFLVLCGCQAREDVPEETVPVKQGLIQENDGTYYYNEDGTLFTGGYKAVGSDYYFFLSDGSAFTGGLQDVTAGDVTGSFFFQEDGKAVTSAWETVDGTAYYFGEDGKAVSNTFLTIDGNRYYFDDRFSPVTGGWFCPEGEETWYYADEAGVLATDTVIEGYKLDAEGKCPTKYRIRELVAQHTEEAMTEQEKIDALYNWVLEGDMTYIRSYEHVKADWVWADSWVDDMAADQLDKWGGNCFRYGALMGMLIREATGLPVSVAIGDTMALAGGLTPHCWVQVCQEDSWYIYDVEMQKFTETPDYNCYKIPADDSFLHMNPVLFPLYSE